MKVKKSHLTIIQKWILSFSLISPRWSWYLCWLTLIMLYTVVCFDLSREKKFSLFLFNLTLKLSLKLKKSSENVKVFLKNQIQQKKSFFSNIQIIFFALYIPKVVFFHINSVYLSKAFLLCKLQENYYWNSPQLKVKKSFFFVLVIFVFI